MYKLICIDIDYQDVVEVFLNVQYASRIIKVDWNELHFSDEWHRYIWYQLPMHQNEIIIKLNYYLAICK